MLFIKWGPSTISVIITFKYLSYAYQFELVNPKTTKSNAKMTVARNPKCTHFMQTPNDKKAYQKYIMMNLFASWQRKTCIHQQNLFPPTFLWSALSCDQHNPLKPITLRHLLFRSDSYRLIPWNSLNDCCFYVLNQPHKRTNLAFFGWTKKKI